ncbi:MAG: acyl-CoA carboxylase subunit beta [Noviherbaspirillum sp.]
MDLNHNTLAQSREQALQPDADLSAARHAEGRLTARERLELLLDQDSFVELDMFAGQRGADPGLSGQGRFGDGVVTGHGTVNGRTVFVYAKDMTVCQGSLSEAHAGKIHKVQDLALKSRAPLVGLFDSEGARIQDGLSALAGYGVQYRRAIAASGIIPQISLVLGPCPGAEAFAASISDFVLMAEGSGQLFVSGPEVAEAVAGESVTREELGGAAVHAQHSSIADVTCANEVDAILQARRLLDFLPSHHEEERTGWASFDADARVEPSLDTLVPDDPDAPYDVKELLRKVADEGDFFEIQPAFASNLVAGLMRISGKTVGVVANQPLVLAGALDGDACRKAARFVGFCDAFGIPVATFVDTPGFVPGTAQEHGGLARHGADLLAAYARAGVPLVSFVLRKAFGAAGLMMAAREVGCDMRFAWPRATIGLVGAKGAQAILEGQDGAPGLDAAGYVERHASGFAAAAQGQVDDIVLPRDTRPRLAAALRALAAKHARRRHGGTSL